MGNGVDRRRFAAGTMGVFTLGVTGLIGVSCKTTGGSGLLSDEDRDRAGPEAAKVAAAAGPQNPVRRSITDPSNANNVALYAKAINRMKATQFPRKIRDENDKLITTDWWEAHALIHMNFCPHGNWFFLPWHRAYLYYFERVIKKFSGDPNFALPYWNWSVDNAIPLAFWSDPDLKHPMPSQNPRGYQPREVGPNSKMPQQAIAKNVVENILNISDFLSFGSGRSAAPRGNGGGTGQLEGTPHNTVHGQIGGDMGAFLSPRDPIFWMHHCNIDRLWAMWQQRMTDKGRSTLPAKAPLFGPQRTLTPALWLGTKLGTFYDVKLEQAADLSATDSSAMTVQQVQSTQALGYGYDTVTQVSMQLTEAAGPLLSVQQPTDQQVVPLQFQLEVDDPGKTVLFTIQRTSELQNVLERAEQQLDADGAGLPNLRLCADNVIVPLNPATASLEFFIMYGANTGAERPTSIGAHSFFGTSHVHAGHAGGRPTVNLIFDLIQPLRALRDAGHDLAQGQGDIQLLVHVKSENAFPGHASFDPIQIRVEYDAFS